MALAEFVHSVPKVELHVHLEGTVQPTTLLALARKNDVVLPAEDEAALGRWYKFRDFDHFVDVYGAICRCLQAPDDFARIAYEFGQQMAQHNIRYAEVTWSPTQHVDDDLSFDELLDGVNAGREQAGRDFGVRMEWIPDIVRCSPQTAAQVASWLGAERSRAGGVVAIGLGGPEIGFPPELFEHAFGTARAAGLHSNPHAGETVGPSSIWGALNALGAERIGHGVRAVEDERLLSNLRERQVTLEVCPTSNLCLGVAASYEVHPLRRLMEAGVPITINSDDPALFNTTQSDEYYHAVADCGLTVDQLEAAAFEAVRASYLSAADIEALLLEFRAAYAKARRAHGLV